MASKGKSTDAKVFSEINITPLTDIFLVLLIILHGDHRGHRGIRRSR